MATPHDAPQLASSDDGAGLPLPTATHRDLMAEAKLAEMFGREAYTGVREEVVPDTDPAARDVALNGGGDGGGDGAHLCEGGNVMSAAAPPPPTRVGWGDAYGSVPSQPMYGNPMMTHTNPAVDIDYVLSEKIRRGRELGRLAVVQEEHANLGAAESGYMKALALLVPAARELDVGSELTKNARMNLKSKVQREAAAMLDRVEELKVFLKANGPAVPNELPLIPLMLPSVPKERGRQYGGPRDGGERGARERARREVEGQQDSGASPPPGATSMAQPKKKHPSATKPPNKPPPPPPPFFADNESGELLKRISNRKNVVSAASVGFHSVGVSGMVTNPGSKVSRTGTANCFMCNAPATLVAPCDHAFCKSCGRQAASVFANCPVPGCGKPLSTETFSELE